MSPSYFLVPVKATGELIPGKGVQHVSFRNADGTSMDLGSGGSGVSYVNTVGDLDPAPSGHPVVLVLDAGDGEMGLYAWDGDEWKPLLGAGGGSTGDYIVITHDGAFVSGDMLIWDGAEFNTEVP